MWFQQDACPSHISKLARAALNISQQVDTQIRSDQLSTLIIRSHRP